MDPVFLGIVAVLVIIVIFLFLYIVPLNLWIRALVAGAPIGIGQLVAMRIRKVPATLVVDALINSTKAGLKVTSNDIETHYLAGGNVNQVIRAIISADKANIPLDWKMGTAINLAGRDVFEAVQMSV